MSRSSRHHLHPPRPQLKFRIGLTGHRDLENPDAVRREVHRVLAEIKAWVGSVPKRGAYLDTEAELIFISALASGADCIGAEIALSLGYKLHAVLPFPAADYRTDFKEVDERTLFDRLLDQAREHTLELDGRRGEYLDGSYLAAGEAVLRCCDLLIGVWDEKRGMKTGGAKDIVARAGQMGRLIVWIDATGCKETCWWRESKIFELGLIKEHVIGSLLPPAGSGLPEFYSEREHKWLIRGVSFELAVSVLALRLPHFQIRAQGYRNKSLEDWKPLDAGFPDVAAKYFQPYDQWADNLAIHYAALARGFLTSILFLSALGLSLSLMSHEAWRTCVKAVSPVLALVSAFYFWIARRGEYSRKWIEYRTLSEMLRNSALLCAIGGSLPLRSRVQGKETYSSRWAAWYAAAINRSAGLIPAIFDQDYLEGYWRMLRERIAAQASYHCKRSTEYQRVKRNLYVLSAVFFVGAILAAVIELVDLAGALPAGFPQVKSLVWTSSVVSAALAAFSNFGGFERLTLVSQVVSDDLRKIAIELEGLDRLSHDVLYKKAIQAVEIMMTEHEDWYFYYSLRDVERPL